LQTRVRLRFATFTVDKGSHAEGVSLRLVEASGFVRRSEKRRIY
jgi:hypothetical protein